MTDAAAGGAGAKLACRSVWKTYGPGVEAALRAASGEPVERRIDRVRGAGGIVAAAEVSFDVAEGETFVIMGLSGSGKSTVIRCLSRLVEPSWGEVLLDGESLNRSSAAELIEIRRHKMGMVFQNFGLLPHLTVIENVAFPLRAQGVRRAERLERAARMVALVGLEGREGAWPDELSGGQQQRVGIARSLAVEPEVWFLDEPFSALDPLIRTQMQDEFLRLKSGLGKTIVFVTHDFLESLRLADRICVMKDGCVAQIGRPADIVLRPADAYVREFTRSVPLGKVLRAQDVMDSPRPGPGRRPAVARTTLLDEVIAAFDEQAEAVDVLDADGAVCGLLTPLRIVRALRQEGAAA